VAAEERLKPEARAALDAQLAGLNGLLGAVTPYKLALARPADLAPAPKNAHYMPKRTFDALTANIARDGNLSSLPFCWRRPDGTLELLSGHQRTESARAAGVALILVLYTDAELSEGQRIATLLSHNALVGQDNPEILKELWNRIDALEWKVYAGLDDALLETFQKVDCQRLAEERLEMERLELLFLPPERERIEELVKEIGKRKATRLAAPLDLWDAFFDALLSYKEAAGIMNTATAFLHLIELAHAQVERHAAEQEADVAGSEES
jgi:hypothetical protein